MSWHKTLEDPAYVGPFVVWANERIDRLAADTDAPVNEFCQRIGWPGEAGVRRLLHMRVGEKLWAERDMLAEAIHHYGGAWWDLYPVRNVTRRKAPSNKGTAFLCDEQVFLDAHRMYWDQDMSLRAVAAALHDRTDYASPAAFANRLGEVFKARGWEVRGRSEATAASNVRRGFRPQCQHVFKAGRRKGLRCDQRANGNDEWCWKHHPDRDRVAALRSRPNHRDERAKQKQADVLAWLGKHGPCEVPTPVASPQLMASLHSRGLVTRTGLPAREGGTYIYDVW